MNKLPEFKVNPALVMVTVFGETTFQASFSMAAKIRQAGISVQVYPEAGKLGKQYKYADRIGTRFVITLGPDEIEKGTAQIRPGQRRTDEHQAG